MNQGSAYDRAGVSLDGAETALDGIRAAVTSTYDRRVLAGIGSFGGVFALTDLPSEPVLVASTDGVGTKTMVATALGRLDGIGEDLVNHCVNDILVQGARPLFFLDYVASARLVPDEIAAVVGGAARACRDAGIPLLGGETAEMPGVYRQGELDLVGTIVGVASRESLIDGSRVAAGDVVLALPSSGLHTNGFSLARAALAGRYGERLGDATIGEVLLTPHRSYLESVSPLLAVPQLVRAMAHITGGGIPGNLSRVLPAGLGASIVRRSWPVPGIFDLIQEAGGVDDAEMDRVFNMGAGFLLVVAESDVERVRALCPEPLHEIGRIVEGDGVRIA